MKQNVLEPDTTNGHEPAAAAGATVKSFLDASNRLRDRITTALKSVGLTWPKYELLDQLRHAANTQLPLRVLADCQGCAASNITQLVDRLETEGFVRRIDDPEDRRSVRAELTAAGMEAAIKGEEQIEAVREFYRSRFTEQERAELGRLLEKI